MTERPLTDKVPAEIARGWQMLVDRAEAETDARVRANLEIVGMHVVEEIAGNIDSLMATLAPEPEYLFVTDSAATRVHGRVAVQALYDRAVAIGRNRREFELSVVLADRTHVVTEGTMRQVMPGSLLDRFAIEHEAPAEDGSWYLTQKDCIIVWPIDAAGLITGERVYGRAEYVLRAIEAEEFPLLGPAGRGQG